MLKYALSKVVRLSGYKSEPNVVRANPHQQSSMCTAEPETYERGNDIRTYPLQGRTNNIGPREAAQVNFLCRHLLVFLHTRLAKILP